MATCSLSLLPVSCKSFLAVKSSTWRTGDKAFLLKPPVSHRNQRVKTEKTAIGVKAAIADLREKDGSSSIGDRWPASKGKPEADVVIIGSGIGGLCCGALLARYGLSVLIVESHSIPGGASHSFVRNGFHFDSGPSLFSGLSSRGPQANPLAQVFDALGETVPCVKYDSWKCYLPEGDFLTRIGPTQFYEVLEKFAGPGGVEDWRKLLATVEPLSSSAMALPPAALRSDPGVAITALFRYGPSLLQTFFRNGPAGAAEASKLIGPFSELVKSTGVKDPFVLNWLDLLSFLLSGLKADGTLAAEIVYMFGEWYKPGCVLEYPMGGTDAIIQALIRGLEKFGGRLSLSSHVEEVILDGGKATGVRLRGGQVIKAKKAVISNASVWDTLRFLPPGSLPPNYQKEASETPQCESFMHLHLGFDRKYVPDDLEIHHIVVNDWSLGVDSPQNVVLISIPSVLDPSLAPPGKHSLHAYTPGSEPFSVWEGLDRNGPEYKRLKEERAEVMWKAVERALGPKFSREVCEVSLVGTPLTHSRYLRRDRGTYGPAIRAGQGNFPGSVSPIPGLYFCGDSTFPGIGVPAVAASGVVAANTLVPVWDHWRLLDAMGV